MDQLNYIKHLNGLYACFAKDPRLNPTHISLYMALFQLANNHRFPEIFYISRNEVMLLSKIGSHSTYHKCLKDLDHWSYIKYLPSFNPFMGSRVKLYNFEPGAVQASSGRHPKIDTGTKQVLVSKTNKNKQYKQNKNKNKQGPPDHVQWVIDFFKKENWPKQEAEKFFHYYLSLDWRIGKTNITDWQALAKTWMLRAADKPRQPKNPGKNGSNLDIAKNKNYMEPL